MNYENETFSDLNIINERMEDNQFFECIFKNCSFQENQIMNCAFKRCVFERCRILNNKFKYSDSFQCEFFDCNIVGMNWSELIKTKSRFLPFSILQECTFKYSVFFSMPLKKFKFETCNIIGSFFEECNLVESSFYECNLKDTLFSNNDLRGADFRNAKSYQIAIETNKLQKAKFSFPDVIQLLSSLEIEIE